MKKVILCTVAMLGCVIFFSEAKAQQRTEFGIRGGVNWQNLTGEDANGVDFRNHLNTRFHAGVNVSIPIASDFVIRPEVLFAGKGAKNVNGHEYKVNYIEVPVNLIYKPRLGNGNLMLGFGPYVAHGVGGKINMSDGSVRDVRFAENVRMGDASNAAYFRKMDAGANVLTGYDFGRMSIELHAQLGLMNIQPQVDGVNPTSKMYNTGFGISVGVGL